MPSITARVSLKEMYNVANRIDGIEPSPFGFFLSPVTHALPLSYTRSILPTGIEPATKRQRQFRERKNTCITSSFAVTTKHSYIAGKDLHPTYPLGRPLSHARFRTGCVTYSATAILESISQYYSNSLIRLFLDTCSARSGHVVKCINAKNHNRQIIDGLTFVPPDGLLINPIEVRKL